MTELSKINFTEFRNQFSIPSDLCRIILKKLRYSVVREGTEQYIVGENPHNVSNEYYLKHAIMEYRGGNTTLTRTLSGKFLELDVELSSGRAKIGVSTFSDDAVEPYALGIKRKPNKESKMVLVPRNRADELMVKQSAPPVAPSPVGGMDALQVLVSALQAVQAPQQPPDPLQAHRDLMEAVEQKYLLTGEVVGELLGWSKSTITSKKSGFKKLGFQFEKVKEGSATLWRVSQY
jgi:hypothetical protein